MTATARPPAIPDVVPTFREAMAGFPSGVTIVTTASDDGTWWGFTATAFCSVSMDPPLVLVCLSLKAQCHPVFLSARRWAVNVLCNDQAALAVRFATRGEDKFAGGGFSAGSEGLPLLSGSRAALECRALDRYEHGDHSVLIGGVERVHVGVGDTLVHADRAFRRLVPAV